MISEKLCFKHELNTEYNYPLPSDFKLRFYSDDQDIDSWVKILVATEEFTNESDARARFNREFSPHLFDVKKRMLFIETTNGRVIGTATAWYEKLSDNEIGKLHWVEIKPEYQSRGLGRPLITEAMNILNKYHSEAFLVTQTRSEAAIHLYKKLGWFIIES